MIDHRGLVEIRLFGHDDATGRRGERRTTKPGSTLIIVGRTGEFFSPVKDSWRPLANEPDDGVSCLTRAWRGWRTGTRPDELAIRRALSDGNLRSSPGLKAAISDRRRLPHRGDYAR